MKKQYSRIHGNAGFSVLELLAVMAVLGVIFAAATPKVSAAIRNSRLNRAASVIALDLELAHSLAARQRTPVRITFSASSLEYTFTDRATGTVLHRRLLGAQSAFQLRTLSAIPAIVDILPNGLSTSALTIGVGMIDETQTVTMSSAGHVRVIR